MKRLILLAALVTTSANASDVWLDLHIGTIHDKTEIITNEGEHYDINSFNPGIGLTWPAYEMDGTPMDYMSYKAGVYYNSYKRPSFYLGLDPHTSDRRPLQLGVMLGVVSGYGTVTEDVLGAVVPHLSYTYKEIYKVDLKYIHGMYARAVALSVAYRF